MRIAIPPPPRISSVHNARAAGASLPSGSGRSSTIASGGVVELVAGGLATGGPALGLRRVLGGGVEGELLRLGGRGLRTRAACRLGLLVGGGSRSLRLG